MGKIPERIVEDNGGAGALAGGNDSPGFTADSDGIVGIGAHPAAMVSPKKSKPPFGKPSAVVEPTTKIENLPGNKIAMNVPCGGQDIPYGRLECRRHALVAVQSEDPFGTGRIKSVVFLGNVTRPWVLEHPGSPARTRRTSACTWSQARSLV